MSGFWTCHECGAEMYGFENCQFCGAHKGGGYRMEETERIMKFKSVEKLRHYAHVLKGGSTDYNELFEIADEIEAEIAERFIELPVGDDGEALEIGDELECLGNRVLLNSLSWNGKDWYATETVFSSGWYEACNCRHVKSLEDVLRECAEAYASGADVELGSTDAMFSKYADKIRNLLGGGAL